MNIRRRATASTRIAAGWLAVALLVLVDVASPAKAQEKEAPAPAAAAPPSRVAGTIELAAGDTMIEARDGKARQPKVGDTVSEGDTIVTFRQAELHVHMQDGAYLSVRENTRLKIAAYVAEGGKNDTSVLELAQGALRSVTGWIGKFNRAAYQIRTPTATIGVRGTDHEPAVVPVGDPRGEPGTYDKVNEGRTFMQTGRDVVEVGANQAAFHGFSGAAKPRVLPSVPVFFKPAPNEQRFVARSQEVRATLDTRRLERQEAVRRGPDGRREAPSKAAPDARRPGAQSQPVGPAAAGARAPAPGPHGPGAAPGGPAAKRGAGYPSSAPTGAPDGAKGHRQGDRAIEREKTRGGRASPKQHEEAGEPRAPQGTAGHRR